MHFRTTGLLLLGAMALPASATAQTTPSRTSSPPTKPDDGPDVLHIPACRTAAFCFSQTDRPSLAPFDDNGYLSL
jgi:hypothetical protein